MKGQLPKTVDLYFRQPSVEIFLFIAVSSVRSWYLKHSIDEGLINIVAIGNPLLCFWQ